MMMSCGLGGRGGSFSITTDRGGGGTGGRVRVTTCADRDRTRTLREKFDGEEQGVPVMISGIRGGRSRRMIGGGESGGGAR